MISINNISKRFQNFQLDIEELLVEQGTYVVILGDSGSGKSLLLEIMAGLINPDHGTITFEKKNLISAAIQDRPFGLVFQDQALFPHLTVRQNIAYPLKRFTKNRHQIMIRTSELAKKTEATLLLDRYPETLSGGEKQRVALARTLATEPACLLLDEPLSSLDAKLKKEIRALLRWLNRNGQTILHVTHDYEEAIALASHIGVMEKGKLVQFGDAETILKEPRSSFVANFTGIKNYFKVVLEANNQYGEMLARTETDVCVRISTNKSHGQGFIIVPCDSILLSNKQVDTSAANQFEGKIKDISAGRFGVEVLVESRINLVAQVTQSAVEKMHLTMGQSIWVSFKATSVRFIKK